MVDGMRVRFAPSPTGYLHVGGARTALFNWLIARKHGGIFVLRIEDTDRERSSDEMTEAILDGMRWLGLDWDEGPYHQADGFDRHRREAMGLVESGRAYLCFCTPTELQTRRDAAESAGGPGSYRYDRRCVRLSGADVLARRNGDEPYTIRFRVPEGETTWDDLVHGPTRFRNEEIEDFIILRTDGTPIYNLAVVSDDSEMRITHVMRGDDHLSNTPKQIMLYEALGVPVPRFAHLPMILGPDAKRLSKRHGATAVGDYREMGILPQALTNFLALLGWNPGDEQEIMLEHELIARFSLERIGKKSAIFDPEKLEWMNWQHIILTPSHDLIPLLTPALVGAGLATGDEIESRADWFAELIDLLKPRARTLAAISEQMYPFLAPQVDYEPAAVAKYWKDPESVVSHLRQLEGAFGQLANWSGEGIEEALREIAERQSLSFGKLVHPLRLALTGSHASPGIDQVVRLMGPGLVRRRILDAVGFLSSSTPSGT